jgi:hypothetical protein
MPAPKYHDGHELQALIDAAKPDMFNEFAAGREYLNEEALGILVARWATWDCRRVLEVCMAALEDANMHTETAALEASARRMGVFGDAMELPEHVDEFERMEREAAERAAMSHDQVPENRNGSDDAAAAWQAVHDRETEGREYGPPDEPTASEWYCCPGCKTGLAPVEGIAAHEGTIVKCACQRKFAYGVVAGGVLIGNPSDRLPRGWYVFEHIDKRSPLGLWKPVDMAVLLLADADMFTDPEDSDGGRDWEGEAQALKEAQRDAEVSLEETQEYYRWATHMGYEPF